MHVKDLLALLAAILVIKPCHSGDVKLEATEVTKVGECMQRLRYLGAIKLDLEKPVDYFEATDQCDRIHRMKLLFSFSILNASDLTLCGSEIVPVKREHDARLGDPVDQVPAANLSSGRRYSFNESRKFACVLCQHEDLTFPPRDTFGDQDLDAGNHFVALFTSTYIHDLPDVSDNEKDTLIMTLVALLRPYDNETYITFIDSWLDAKKHLQVKLLVEDQILPSAVTGKATTSVLNVSFVLSVEDVGWCPEDETVVVDGGITRWPATQMRASYPDSFVFHTNLSTGSITGRTCKFNATSLQAEWYHQFTRWALVRQPCKSLDEQYANEEYYKQFLDAVDVDRRHANVLQESASTPINTWTLLKVARLVSREINVRDELYASTALSLVNITAHLVMDSDSDHAVATARRADLIVADLGGSESVVGFTLDYDGGRQNITLNRKPTVKGQAHFALDVSARLTEAHSRMAFVVLLKKYVNVSFVADVYFEVTVMFPRKGEVSAWAFASYSNHHVDITYSKLPGYEEYEYFVCVAWSNDLQDWTREGCRELYPGHFSACRCSGKYFALQDGVPIAKYALHRGHTIKVEKAKNNMFTDFLKDKIALMTITAIECLLSVIGLGSITSTAIVFTDWREKAGNKILLHMVLALTCNLVLGFTASFVRMNTEGVGCLVYGVLRHYSFLAMFFWMLSLSLLQMKRLLTVAGAKATTHLILKVSVFAWGVPLVPIVILLSWNPGFYQADRFDRGYCYPEGIVFQVTVQTPAGVILLANLVIFVRIVLGIFGCVGEKKITRHSKNEKAEQLNKLKTSLFIFFLFGFTWVFHIFAEERVIVSDFLFEYLFLMTATTHIFVLALFFVVFQESTRKDWVNLIWEKL